MTHDVHAADPVRGDRDQSLRLLRVPDVRDGERRGAAVGGGRGNGLVAAADHDLRASAQEPLGDAGADALGTAGHDHSAAGKAGKRLVDGLHGVMLGSRPSKR
jgi:hypothetical protein